MKNLFLIFSILIISTQACVDRDEILQFIQESKVGSIEVSEKIAIALDFFESKNFETASFYFDQVLTNDFETPQKSILGQLFGEAYCAPRYLTTLNYLKKDFFKYTNFSSIIIISDLLLIFQV